MKWSLPLLAGANGGTGRGLSPAAKSWSWSGVSGVPGTAIGACWGVRAPPLPPASSVMMLPTLLTLAADGPAGGRLMARAGHYSATDDNGVWHASMVPQERTSSTLRRQRGALRTLHALAAHRERFVVWQPRAEGKIPRVSFAASVSSARTAGLLVGEVPDETSKNRRRIYPLSP